MTVCGEVPTHEHPTHVERYIGEEQDEVGGNCSSSQWLGLQSARNISLYVHNYWSKVQQLLTIILFGTVWKTRLYWLCVLKIHFGNQPTNKNDSFLVGNE